MWATRSRTFEPLKTRRPSRRVLGKCEEVELRTMNFSWQKSRLPRRRKSTMHTIIYRKI